VCHALTILYRVAIVVCCLFFFQAEDGIRDGHVTGVQTCALPICNRNEMMLPGYRTFFLTHDDYLPHNTLTSVARRCSDRLQLGKIGRASCRERVEMSVGGGVVRRKGEEMIAMRPGCAYRSAPTPV